MIQAKDVEEAPILDFIRANMAGIGCSRQALEEKFSSIPQKILRAKLYSLIKRKLISGCICGCRGDFMSLDKHATIDK